MATSGAVVAVGRRSRARSQLAVDELYVGCGSAASGVIAAPGLLRVYAPGWARRVDVVCPSMQCAAVSTHREFITDPPHV